MLKNSKSNNHINSNKNFQFPPNEASNPRYHNNLPKKYNKNQPKMKKANSIINFKESEIINNKKILFSKRNSMKNKYHKIQSINENKEKTNIDSNKTKDLKNNKYIKNSSNTKENKNILNYFSSRKILPKQISFASKLSNDDCPTTIDNELNEIKVPKNSENKRINYLKNSNFQNNKQNLNNKKNNIYDYQINQLKQILIKKQNIENNIEKILSTKFKNNSKNNKNYNYSNNISKKNNNLINTNLTSFSPIQKNNNNNNLYKVSSQSKNSIFSNTNPNINCNNENKTNSQKSLNNNKNIIIYKGIEENKNLAKNKFLKRKVTEKSCPLLNINNNSIKNIKDSYINDENLNKNRSANNIILRNTAGPNLNNIKGALKPFCSLINIPINNKEKKENNNKNNSVYSISNENINYYFDKDKYFNDFKNRMNLNINNLFFKSKRKKWQNIMENKLKNNEYKINKNDNENYLSEENNNYENKNDNNNDNNIHEKLKKINNLLTEKINKIEAKNDKIIRIKKINSINLTNNSNNKICEKPKEDFILNDLYITKRNPRKTSSDNNIDSNPINYTNLIYTKKTDKKSFTSFNRRNINENNKNNKNSYFINANSTNNKGRNDNNVLNNNFFEPQTTIYQKNNFYKSRLNKNINSNSNRNNYTQNLRKNPKNRNNKEKNENKSVITTSRNKNIDKEISNNDYSNENNYLKIIKLFDELTKFKKTKKGKKKDLEICFLNNSSSNSNNNIFGNITLNKRKKEKKQKIKIEIDENKIKENISQNTLTMYTIYILSKYYSNCKKVGLLKINIFDKNGNNIPVICYNTNSNSNSNKNIGYDTLFNSTIGNNYKLNINKNKDIPFIMEFKKNLYINFYIKNIKSNAIDYIQINNYFDIKNDISPIKDIQIFKGKNLIYKGLLNEKNPINKIYLNFNNKIFNNNMTNKYNKSNDIIKSRPLSSSKPRSCNNILITKSSTYRKSEYNEYYTKRNIFNKSYINRYNFSDNNYNETNYIDKKTKAFLYSTKKHSANDIRNTKLLTSNLRHELNISNIYTINNITNNPQKTQYNNREKFINYNKIIGNNNKNIEQKLFYNSILNINKHDNNLCDISFSINKRHKKPKIINEYDNNSNNKRNGEKIFIKSNSEKKFKKSLIKTQKSLLFKKINEENEKDVNSNFINSAYFNSNYNNNNISKNNINNKKYIEFNKICFVLTSNYGHNKYIGLTGIMFYNLKGDLINIENAVSIGALPKDLKTVLDDNNENRIFENVFNNYNNTNEPENMWVTKFKKTPPLTFIELYFQERIRLSRIKIYNYNEKDNLEIGVKTIDLYLDDQFYKTLFIKKGIGECVNDFITLNNDNNSSNEDFDKYKNYDFGQIITFPIIDDENNFNNYNNSTYGFNNNNTNYLNSLNNNIKYASFLYEQCYETPFLPCGYYIQFQFWSNYNKGNSQMDNFGSLKYNDIGLDSIEIYDNNGINIIEQNNLNMKNKYKILSNCEINHNDNNKIILNVQKETFNNSLFYVFEKEIQISFIKFYPLTNNEIKSLNSLKEIKIFCENNIIFEGDLYLNQPTIILFTCDTKIIKNVNEKYLTNNKKNREYKEILNEEYISLILN